MAHNSALSPKLLYLLHTFSKDGLACQQLSTTLIYK